MSSRGTGREPVMFRQFVTSECQGEGLTLCFARSEHKMLKSTASSTAVKWSTQLTAQPAPMLEKFLWEVQRAHLRLRSWTQAQRL